MSLDSAHQRLVSTTWDGDFPRRGRDQSAEHGEARWGLGHRTWLDRGAALAGTALTTPREGSRTEEFIRRGLDILLSVIGLILLLPLLALVALAVRLDSPGPAIFRQQRVGRNGRLFTFYKFRGMYVDARERWPMLYAYSFNQGEVHELRFHPERDPRVTRVGRIIRRTSIDEVLNLINVLKGDMSLVGPRPEIPEMVPYYGDLASFVLSIKPGVTSLAKASGRDEHTFGQTLMLDVEYILHRSLWLDLKILVGTVGMVLLQRGVKAG